MHLDRWRWIFNTFGIAHTLERGDGMGLVHFFDSLELDGHDILLGAAFEWAAIAVVLLGGVLHHLSEVMAEVIRELLHLKY